MPVGSNGIFARIWRFVDRFGQGDEITRSDLDAAFDDIATAINKNKSEVLPIWQGQWDENNVYYRSNLVTNEGVIYIATRDVPKGTSLLDGTYWTTLVRDGLPGDPGPGAYEYWLELGNAGTEQDFLDDLSAGAISATAANVLAAQEARTFAEAAETKAVEAQTYTAQNLAASITARDQAEGYAADLQVARDAAEAAAVSAQDDANAASLASNAVQWSSGITVELGQLVWSPINFETYRAKTAHSGLTADPSEDSANWLPIKPTLGADAYHLFRIAGA